MKKNTNVVIEQDPEAPIERKVLSRAIIDISEAFQALSKSGGLNRKAIVLLVANSSKTPQYIVSDVLNALETLKKDYTK